MFESGLEWIRTDFHLHTAKDKEFKYSGMQNEFVKNYVAAMKSANVRIGVITNHNKFDKDEYKTFRKVAKKENIFILPGVELTVKEGANGVHTLIVFNPDEWLADGNNHIQTFLTAAFATIPNPESRNTKSVYDLKNTFEALEAYGYDYFVIFAHVDQGSGLFQECKGGLLESLARLASFRKRVLGLQKSRTRDNVEQFKRCFNYLPALVEGSDPKSILDIGKGDRKTFLKVGEYSYSTVKFALQDYTDRVLEEVPEVKHGFIESLVFEGGKFDGQKITFATSLTTLIGIRGSGKSSILEAIRYIFDLSIQSDLEYKKSLINNVFQSGGKATLIVRDKYGKRYEVSRILNERTTVIDEDGNNININPVRLLEGVLYFGQKDLSNSVNQENGLLERLVGGKIDSEAGVDDYAKEMIRAVEQLLDTNKVPTQIEETNTKQKEIEHKMQIYKEKGVSEKLQKQTCYTADKTKLDSIKINIENLVKKLRQAYNSDKTVTDYLKCYDSKYNKELFDKAKGILSLIDQKMMIIDQSIQGIEEQSRAFGEVGESLSKCISGLADEFAEIKREIKDDVLDIDGYVYMTAELEKIKSELDQLNKRRESKENIEAAYKKAARQRNDVLQQIFNKYQLETERINNSQSELKIEITFKGDRDGFKSSLKREFKGSGISDVKYSKICEQFMDYVELIEDWIISDGKVLQSILVPAEYSKLDIKLQEHYSELLKQQVKNKVEIYYHEKSLRRHSIGQRASALILFILTQDSNDIILIDQPEDDLDNKVIYDEVIKAIAKAKTSMQFIFATHNANIPVLGDAERVLVVDYQDTKIDVSQGNIDLEDTHRQIVDIMEGGKEAFKKRQLVYTSWK